jgi:hypothetical protein
MLTLLTSKCTDKKHPDATTCSPSPKEYQNIEYANKYNMLEKKLKYVTVAVTSALIPTDSEGLKTAFMQQIADTLMLATADEKNCYTWDRSREIYLFCKDALYNPPDKRGRVIKWCNAPPQWVKVSIKDEKGEEVTHMKVGLEFTGKTDKGRFDCVAVQGAVGENAEAERGGKMREVLGGKVAVRVQCESAV